MMKRTYLLTGTLIMLFGALLFTHACKKKNDDTTPAATCSDGIQNQGETGVDCGGPCPACGGGGGSCGVPTNLNTSGATTSAITLTWTAVSGATGYKAQYRQSGNTSWTATGTITGTTTTVTGLTAGYTYEFQVQAICASGSSAFTATKTGATSGTGICSPPTAGFSNIPVSATSHNVSWSTVSPPPMGYDVQYKTGAGSWQIYNTPTAGATLTGLTTGATYSWQVRSNCVTPGSSAWSVVNTFTVMTSGTCSDPTGLSATNITKNSATLNWAVVSGANNYSVQYSALSPISWVLISPYPTTSTSANISSLILNTDYMFRVQANCPTGTTNWIYFNFKTLP